MNTRLELHDMLASILGTKNVYFQPPETLKLNYPAIVYSRIDLPNKHADNSVYKQNFKYRVIVIDQDPDSEIVSKISLIPTCRFERHYAANNLNHDAFIIYY